MCECSHKEKRRTVRYTLDVSEPVDELLERLARETNCTKADVLRRAVTLIDIAAEARRNGQHLAILDANGEALKTIVAA